ncbi:uncharacterized protein LOC113240528 [Hyposmocoma kahamanoa]|uniref:uncharacterized protein LOC113240528 n=1 Tax=Hyposmocoma kahamanoa TaxID=1477025 RepID=UPI000E6D5C62|nr:uncharacterized protein LOC113240528 [Hyposmocoma kahamanoa]
MEKWEALLDCLPTVPDQRYYGKTIQTAGVLLKEDLATFETEWITETLLLKPINLLSAIKANNNNNLWSIVLTDFFKLICEYVERWKDVFEKYFVDIVDICYLTHTPQIRNSAIQCLTKVARLSSVPAADIARHIASFEQSQTGRAPMAVLIGTICEYHPEMIAPDDVIYVWRIYLNQLDSNKNTDTINAAVLQGILGLFKHFGCNLPTAELNEFYDKLTGVFIKIKKCEPVCVDILTSYANLFAERITRDAALRHYLWSHNHHVAARACSMVICNSRNNQNIQNLVKELLHHAQSANSQTKYTALRVLQDIQSKSSIVFTTNVQTDVQNLEFELRSGAVEYDTALAISYSIDCNLPNSDKLLQTAILCYDNLPASTRKSTVAYGILNAASDIRNGAIIFLTTETIQDETTIEKHLPLWRDLFDMKDINVLDKCRYIFEDFMTYVIGVLKQLIEEECEKPPEKLHHLHTLTSRILTMHHPENYTLDLSAVYLPLLVALIQQFGCIASAVAAGRAACLHLEEESCIREFYKTISMDRCKDESLLCESCLVLIHAPLGTVDEEDVLAALQITFSRNDVEPRILSNALRSFQSIITSKKDISINNNIRETISFIEKLRNRKDVSGKEARELHRDVIMFLGKYGNNSDLNNNICSTENMMIAKLKDSLSLNIPNPIDGVTYKLNLQRILQLAIIHEEPEALQKLMTILNTFIEWSDPIPASNNLNVTIEALTRTSLENRHRSNIFGKLQDTLSGVLDKCEKVNVGWSLLEPYVHDSEATKTVQLLIRLTKSKTYIPELLPTLLTQMESRRNYPVAKMGELFGSAMAVSDSVGVDTSILNRWKKLLVSLHRDKPSEYVTMVYNAQRMFKECCDEDQFRKITDLTQKLQNRDKAKCLLILSTYISHSQSEYIKEMFETIELSELILNESVEALSVAKEGIFKMEEGLKRRFVIQTSGLCQHSDWKIREAAFGVIVKAFQDLFRTTEQHQPKKPRHTSTKILQTINTDDIYVKTVMSAIGLGLTDRNDSIAKSVITIVEGYLHKDDWAVRFTECIYLTIYQPATTDKAVQLTACATAMLDLVFFQLRSHERFKLCRLRDDPVEFRNTISGPSKLLTMSRTYQGTFRTQALTSRRRNAAYRQVQNTPDIDVQITIDSILESILQFAKNTPEASQALCVQLSKCIQRPGFDFGPNMSILLYGVLKNGTSDLTPLVLELCRVFVGDVWKVNGFSTALSNLLLTTKSTEAEHIVKVIYEDALLRSNDDSVVLGNNEYVNDVYMDENKPFSLDDLTSMFNKLSNWDNLTIQQKRNIEQSGIPTLWADDDVFKTALESYTGTEGWFSKMVSAYKHEDQQNAMKWLKEMDRWPRRHFAISAVIEAIQWQTEEKTFTCNILPSDCLAEWAARFMIRSLFFSTQADSEMSLSGQNMQSRSHELSWCKRANEMALPSLALDCVKRNATNLYEDETLPWLHEKLSALRAVGLRKNDHDILRKALHNAETNTPKFLHQSTPAAIIAMKKLILQLNCDLQSTSVEQTDDILEEINAYTRDCTGNNDLNHLYDISVIILDNIWQNSDTSQHNELLSTMSNILDRVTGQFRREMFLNVILNRLDDYCDTLPEHLAKKLLDVIQTISPDEFTTNHLLKLTKLFPTHLPPLYSFMSERNNNSLLKYKKCLQLICDPEYTLFKYCEALLHSLSAYDPDKWTKLFDNMKQKIFENPHKGSDYLLLTKYKEKLYELYDYVPIPSVKAPTEKALKDLLRQLHNAEPRTELRLSQLCPLLGERCEDTDVYLAKLLGLKPGCFVVKFDEQVPVFTDSIRRPIILRALLTNGTYKNFMIKSGEPLITDAAAQRVVRHAGLMWEEKVGQNYVVSYKVTPLSDDCGLIEYLEDHDRLRSLISNARDLGTEYDASVARIRRPDDSELLLSPVPSLVQKHNQLRSLVPAYTLRDAILQTCVSIQEFVSKREQFQNCLAGVTVLGWILGENTET